MVLQGSSRVGPRLVSPGADIGRALKSFTLISWNRPTLFNMKRKRQKHAPSILHCVGETSDDNLMDWHSFRVLSVWEFSAKLPTPGFGSVDPARPMAG